MSAGWMKAARIVVDRRTVSSFDGTPLAVQTAGRTPAPNGIGTLHGPGPAEGSARTADAPILLLVNGLGATVDAYRFIVGRFAPTFRFVSWDYRGLYGSGRPVRGYDALAVADHAKDAFAVLDAVGAGSGKAEVHALGWSMGVQVLLEMLREKPDAFETLVLHNGVPGRPWASLAGGALKAVVDPALAAAQRVDGTLERVVDRVVGWGGFIPWAIRLGLVNRDVERDAFTDVAQNFRHLDMHLYVEIVRQLGHHDATDVLPKIHAPTLILQGTHDKLTPPSTAQHMAQRIASSTLVMLPGGTHYAAVEMPDVINGHLEQFWKLAGLDVDGRPA